MGCAGMSTYRTPRWDTPATIRKVIDPEPQHLALATEAQLLSEAQLLIANCT